MSATYAAEIQGRDETREHRGTAADVAAWLSCYHGCPAGRAVSVWRVEADGDWTLVDMRSTREQGSAPAGYQGDWRRDPVWDAAVGAS